VFASALASRGEPPPALAMSSACSPSRCPAGGRRHRRERWPAALGNSARLGRGAETVRRCAAGGDPAPLLSGPLLLALHPPIALRRDIGAGLLHTTDAAEPRLFPLSSTPPLRGELGAGRLVRRGAFALITGIISDSFSSGLSVARRHRQFAAGRCRRHRAR
jgi:hypothetical protein